MNKFFVLDRSNGQTIINVNRIEYVECDKISKKWYVHLLSGFWENLTEEEYNGLVELLLERTKRLDHTEVWEVKDVE